MEFETKDSGEHVEFSGGGRRDVQTGKPRFDLTRPKTVPYDDQMLTRFAALMGRGAEKYADRNWEQFSDQAALDRAKASANRHFEQWINGETDEDHAAAIYANVMFAEYVAGVLDGRWPALGQTETVFMAEFPVGVLSLTREALRDLTRSADEDGLYDEGTGFVDTRSSDPHWYAAGGLVPPGAALSLDGDCGHGLPAPTVVDIRPWPAIGELVNPGFGEPDRAGFYLDSDKYYQQAEWSFEEGAWFYRLDGERNHIPRTWTQLEEEFGEELWPWKRIS